MSILKQSQRIIVTAALTAVMLTGCGLAQSTAGESAPAAEVAVNYAAPEPAGEGAAVIMAAKSEAELPAADAVETFAAEAAPAAEPMARSDADFAPQQAPSLRAGEVDDNARWDDYLLYRRNYRGPIVHEQDISERYIIQVANEQGQPVLGATVRVSLPGQPERDIYSAHTPANGQALFHPAALDLPLDQVDHFQVVVEKGQARQEFALTRYAAQAATDFSERWPVTLASQPARESLELDVLFLIDATGSMADEIAKIQNTIFDVSAQVDALPTQPNPRYGLVAYRDRGDSFVTRSYEFTPNVRDFANNLELVRADGGGDYPESLNEGLHHALHSVEWRGAEAVKLIFLIADAPPHLDYPQDYDYAVEMETAARRGIKIFPIASSGLDDQGEYIFRQLAQYTQGRFIFLTYADASNGGAPGDVTTHHVDDYSVGNLDALLVRLIQAELAHQNPHLAQRP